MINFEPPGAWGIRFHGKMWLVFGKIAPLGAETHGWRPYIWSKDVEKAERWGSETAARGFAERRLIGPFEIAKIGPNQRSVDHLA